MTSLMVELTAKVEAAPCVHASLDFPGCAGIARKHPVCAVDAILASLGEERRDIYEYVEARLIALGQTKTKVPFSQIAVDATLEFLACRD